MLKASSFNWPGKIGNTRLNFLSFIFGPIFKFFQPRIFCAGLGVISYKSSEISGMEKSPSCQPRRKSKSNQTIIVLVDFGLKIA